MLKFSRLFSINVRIVVFFTLVIVFQYKLILTASVFFIHINFTRMLDLFDFLKLWL